MNLREMGPGGPKPHSRTLTTGYCYECRLVCACQNSLRQTCPLCSYQLVVMGNPDDAFLFFFHVKSRLTSTEEHCVPEPFLPDIDSSTRADRLHRALPLVGTIL